MNNIENENSKEIINQFLKLKNNDTYINLEDDEILIRSNIILNIMILRNDIEKSLYSKVSVLMTKSDFKIENLISASEYINAEIKEKVKNYYKKHNKIHNNLISLHKRRGVL